MRWHLISTGRAAILSAGESYSYSLQVIKLVNRGGVVGPSRSTEIFSVKIGFKPKIKISRSETRCIPRTQNDTRWLFSSTAVCSAYPTIFQHNMLQPLCLTLVDCPSRIVSISRILSPSSGTAWSRARIPAIQCNARRSPVVLTSSLMGRISMQPTCAGGIFEAIRIASSRFVASIR